ncbi:MAG: glycine zipper 2TM domain-containing protein [Ramlibacter sp.]|nr:glycine zipper 2TM domain-containing protein [Ramlibacter sp.]
MKRFAIASLLAASVVGAQAQTFIDQARVRSVDPQYENVGVPRNECTSQWINESRRTGGGDFYGGGGVGAGNYGGAVIGGVAGAILGNQVGKGSGRQAATAVGAVVGAFAGDRLGNQGQWQPQYQQQYQEVPREVTRCRTVSDVQTRITGYRVNYEYRGQAYSTLMRENPGHQLPVRVTVEPVERY